ncbi:unnamed protein product [Polarella glacialis]|uniref:Uncharacterized protein n=1 Tax=Polarella glacialis TaxID=89957 RepID=A0A813H7P3_POLGL|nr:unnamed protein product [Polarella glacialis]
MTAEAAAAIPAAESLIEVLIESASSLDETYLYKGDSASIRLVPSLSLATECCRYSVCLCDYAHGRLARPKTEEGKKGKLSVLERAKDWCICSKVQLRRKCRQQRWRLRRCIFKALSTGRRQRRH